MISVTVDDMRAAGKPGYVAKLVGSDRQFLNADSYSGHGASRKQITYKISEDEIGLYEICDANFGARKRRISFIAVSLSGWEQFADRKDAENFLNPPTDTVTHTPEKVGATGESVQASYPGLKPESVATEAAISLDVRAAVCNFKEQRFLKVEIKSDDGFKLFLPDMKNRVPGREWNAGSKCWLIPLDSALQLREVIEERTIRTNGIRKPLNIEITGKAKEIMAID